MNSSMDMTKNDLIRFYGKDILQSELFEKCKKQKHHLRTDVASHSINTARFCIRIHYLLKCFEVDSDLSSLIISALSHDLGMDDRSRRFSSTQDCYLRHPSESVTLLRELSPDIDPKVLDAVSSHMFPASKKAPGSTEAWVLCMADKCAAVTDWFCHYEL